MQNKDEERGEEAGRPIASQIAGWLYQFTDQFDSADSEEGGGKRERGGRTTNGFADRQLIRIVNFRDQFDSEEEGEGR